MSYDTNRYWATVIAWKDGDTAKLRVDLGQSVLIEGSYRLLGINAPEVHLGAGVDQAQKDRGLALKTRLEAEFPPGAAFWISTTKPDKYGRLLCTVHLKDGGTLNDRLLKEGVVTAYDGHGPKT